MSILNTPICQETFIHVLKEKSEYTKGFKVFYDISKPRELKITQNGLTITYKLPDDVDVPEDMLSNVCRRYQIMRVEFMLPLLLNIKK